MTIVYIVSHGEVRVKRLSNFSTVPCAWGKNIDGKDMIMIGVDSTCAIVLKGKNEYPSFGFFPTYNFVCIVTYY